MPPRAQRHAAHSTLSTRPSAPPHLPAENTTVVVESNDYTYTDNSYNEYDDDSYW